MKATRFFFCAIPVAAAIIVVFGASAANPRQTQGASPKPAEKTPQKTQEKAAIKPAPKIPAEIELLETRIRFEANGDSRKEVHARVKINDELGVRQFARLNFDFNRAFEKIEIPLVRVTHPSGGTADVLPSAITDTPNPAVVNAPAYQDVRVKSVRILGLEPGDSLEYRVITTVSHHPLAPNFWMDHTFDRTGVVSHEIFEFDLPTSLAESAKANQYNVPFTINPLTPVSSTSKSGEGSSGRTLYRWDFKNLSDPSHDAETKEDSGSDIEFSTFSDWQFMSIELANKLLSGAVPTEKLQTFQSSGEKLNSEYEATPAIKEKAAALTAQSKNSAQSLEALYEFVSGKISTIDLPLGATGFSSRPAKDVLESAYGTQEDKYVLFAALASAQNLSARAALSGYCNEKGTPRPSPFRHLLVSARDGKSTIWLDPGVEVAPFGMLPPNSGKCAFVLDRDFSFLSSLGHGWEPLHVVPPFPSFQRVSLEATISADAKLVIKAKYAVRGENELLLRVAFHTTPKEGWKNVAQLLALSDGFRGQISNVTTSDPYATREPFTVEYEITQPKFIDWSKKPLRVPALLPLLGLPEPPAKPEVGAAAPPIDLGTPLDVDVSVTLHLPTGTTARIPTGTSVQRDFASYTSQYSAKDATLTASRHLNFILKEIPADRASDYNAFLRTVQNDESQVFTLERSEATPAAPPKTQ